MLKTTFNRYYNKMAEQFSDFVTITIDISVNAKNRLVDVAIKITEILKSLYCDLPTNIGTSTYYFKFDAKHRKTSYSF